MSVCPPEWNNAASTGRVFMEFDIWVFFKNLSRKSVSLKSDTTKNYFEHVYDVSLDSS